MSVIITQVSQLGGWPTGFLHSSLVFYLARAGNMNPKEIGDLAAFFAAIATVAFGVSVDNASLIGMWLAIFFCATCGSLVALGMSESGYDKPWGWFRMCWFVGVRVGCAMALTMSIVRVLSVYVPDMGPGVLMCFVSFSITCDPMRKWVISLIKRNAPAVAKKVFGDDR